MSQFSLIPALEAARVWNTDVRAHSDHPSERFPSHVSPPMAPPNRPTAAQIAYLKRLTGIRTDTQLARYVARKISDASASDPKAILTRRDFAKAIDLEVAEKRWTN